ncbi:unnamed protein product [Parascedosporium putredinis]|uniref:Protein-tyrosine-phosphatase n=1 Tax=Parascedosporium putredinis TaxID=1442378 RepID=A0A9P1GXS7_9PEZI|nr:unnamed protein product [Parascedosporium putredinis]CAI7990894.1 unnamed protein product [Parascedosporium putredinis]
MATIALTRPIPPRRPNSSTVSGVAQLPSIDGAPTSGSQSVPAVPNKHIPACPPGPIPPIDDNADLETGRSSPVPESHGSTTQASLLYPPRNSSCIKSDGLSVYSLSAADVAASLTYSACQPLPNPADVFPWLHGIHPHNHIQQTFFTARQSSSVSIPQCLRGVTIVKADGDLTISRLKGAISPTEIIQLGTPAEFLDIDPREGFSVRNFHIQVVKLATTSDIVVYGEDAVAVTKIGWEIAEAQHRWRLAHEEPEQPLAEYNTFICICPFSDFENSHQELVAVDSKGHGTDDVLDFFVQERTEMYCMAMASEISHNVWVGPTPFPDSGDEQEYDVMIECSDLGHINPAALRAIVENKQRPLPRNNFDFPSSGSIMPPTWSHAEADGILETCKWIYHLAHGTCPHPSSETSATENGYSNHVRVPPLKILLHCADGYTESTMLAIAYFSFSTGRPIPDAWLALHMEKRHLLRALGIGQVLSVGETAVWRDGERDLWGEDNLYTVECVQDNGIDPLTEVFDRCLEFIERGRKNGTATLVHCRVGVSRSATICIAEVMRTLELSFPRAYCFVRARRLNVIIQPHLRFAYELLKWEETLRSRGQDKVGWQRELEWAHIAREIALMNRPYANR